MAGLMMAAHCALGPCVQVYTDPTTHQLIISAKQNRPATRVIPHPYPTHTYKPRPRPVAKPKPRVQSWVPYKAIPVVHRTYRATPRKRASTIAKVVTTALSLSDQITRLLPGSKILYQPNKDAITGVPVYFWSDTNALFHVATEILGIGVNVLMKPSYVWNFGDGSTFSTTNVGGPYPNSTITHTYKSAGNYTVNLAISWAGSWAAQGAVLPVLGGAIVQNASTILQVSPGPTDFTR